VRAASIAAIIAGKTSCPLHNQLQLAPVGRAIIPDILCSGEQIATLSPVMKPDRYKF
jgi:hypothetical protein